MATKTRAHIYIHAKSSPAAWVNGMTMTQRMQTGSWSWGAIVVKSYERELLNSPTITHDNWAGRVDTPTIIWKVFGVDW